MTKNLRIVLDVLMPLNLSEVELARKLAEVKGVEAADVNIKEMEKRVQTAKITLEGFDLNMDSILVVLDSTGVSVKNVDRVSTGKKLISG
jgi:hypothetical protein